MTSSCVRLITVWWLQCYVSKVRVLVGDSVLKHPLRRVAHFLPQEMAFTHSELARLWTQDVQVLAIKSKKPMAGVSKTTRIEKTLDKRRR